MNSWTFCLSLLKYFAGKKDLLFCGYFNWKIFISNQIWRTTKCLTNKRYLFSLQIIVNCKIVNSARKSIKQISFLPTEDRAGRWTEAGVSLTTVQGGSAAIIPSADLRRVTTQRRSQLSPECRMAALPDLSALWRSFLQKSVQARSFGKTLLLHCWTLHYCVTLSLKKFTNRFLWMTPKLERGVRYWNNNISAICSTVFTAYCNKPTIHWASKVK